MENTMLYNSKGDKTSPNKKDKEKKECQSCFGTGTIFTAEEDLEDTGEYKDCHTCNGTGYVDKDSDDFSDDDDNLADQADIHYDERDIV